jgi:hypothetical protein
LHHLCGEINAQVSFWQWLASLPFARKNASRFIHDHDETIQEVDITMILLVTKVSETPK